MVELKGTEKQIAWAEEIRKNMLVKAEKDNEANEKMIAKQGKLNVATEKFRNNIKEFYKRIEVEESAKWYIENKDKRIRTYNEFWN